MSEQKVTLYHCTLTKYVPKILKKGILLMQRSNWVVSGTGERYGGGYIFAFDNYKDAVTWAMKWDWNLNDNFGTGQISIVEFLANPEDWSEDDSDPLTRYSYRGKWLKSNKRVPPEDITNTVVCTESVIQAARSQNPRPRNQVFRVKTDYGGYIELTVAVVDGYRVAYLSKDSRGNAFEVGKPRKGGGIGSYRFYALNSDGTPDLELYVESDGGDHGGKWSLVGSDTFNDIGFDHYDTRKSALRALVEVKASGRRTENPDDPNDTSWVPKRRAPLKRDYEDELESYDMEIKPISRSVEDTELRERAKKFLAGGQELKQSIIAKYQSPLAKYAPRAAITRFRVEVPNNRVFVYGYDPHLRFGEGAFFCDLYQLLSDNQSAKRIADVGLRLNNIGNNEVLSVIEDYDLSEYIPFEHIANLRRGKPFDRTDNPSSRRANPEVSAELSVPARFEITKAFLENEYPDIVERGYAIGYLRHLLYDTRKPETNEISPSRRAEIAKTVKSESENDD